MKSILQRTAVAVLFAASFGLANAATLHLNLTGAEEVPPVKTDAHGKATIHVAPDGAVSGKVTTQGVKGTMAHIHEAPAPGKNGPPIIVLKKGPHGTWLVPKGSKLTPAQYKAYEAGDLYVNVHSAKHKSGAIRAWLKPTK